jgi:GAF domain-containing protein
MVKGGELVLGPFQGPIACTRIQKGKGVCGSVWAEAKTIVVSDVEAFPGHIACSSASKSEIVVPGFKNNEVALVLDIDSDELNTFDDTDQKYLEELMKTVSEFL